jgi:hypothetical protein
MNARRARLLIWVAFLGAMPVPLVLVGRGRMPVGALVELAAATLSVAVLERADGVVRILATLLVAQIVVWALVGWLAAWLVASVLNRVAGRRLGGAALAMVVTLVGLALSLPIYRSPFHAARARQTLLEVYE